MALPKYQVEADASTTHDMLVATAIMAGVGMFAVILAGQSKTTGNVIAGILAIMLLVQGLTHVNPFVEFLANHSLTPKTLESTNIYSTQPTANTKTVGRLKAE